MPTTSQKPSVQGDRPSANEGHALQFPTFEECDGVPTQTYIRLREVWMTSSPFLSPDERDTFLQLVPRAKLGRSTRSIVNQCIAQELKAHPERANQAHCLVLKDIFGAKALLTRDWWPRFRQRFPEEAARTEQEAAREQRIRPPEEIPCAPTTTRRSARPAPARAKRKHEEETMSVRRSKEPRRGPEHTPTNLPTATIAANNRVFSVPTQRTKPPAPRPGQKIARSSSSWIPPLPMMPQVPDHSTNTPLERGRRTRTITGAQGAQTPEETLKTENERLRDENLQLKAKVEAMEQERGEIREAFEKLQTKTGRAMDSFSRRL